MKHYQKPDGSVWAFEDDGSQDSLITPDMVQISQEALPKPPPYVPQSVSMRQARRVLLAAGLLALVDEAISSLPEPQRSAARIDWEYGSEVQRDDPAFNLVIAALGLTAPELDDLFTKASQL